MNSKTQKTGADSAPRVLIDCDGVLSNFTKQLFKYTKVEPFEFKEWGFIGEDARMPWSKASTAAKTQYFCSTMEPYPMARAFVNSFENFYVVTSPWHSSSFWVPERYRWLQKEVGVPPSKVVITSAKELIKGDFLIDDKAENIVKWCAAWPEGKGVLFSDLDKDIMLPENAVRITSYTEVMVYVQGNSKNVQQLTLC